MRLDHLEFRFPIAEHMGFETGDSTHLSNPIIEPFGSDGIFIFPNFE
jgi:hypothetical protein